MPSFYPTPGPTSYLWTSVYVLGPYSSVFYLPSGFPNPSAGWIWNSPNAQSDSIPVNVYTFFMKVYYSPTAITGTVFMVCDDVGYLYLNGQAVLVTNSNSIYQKSVSLQAGNNDILVMAYNTGGWAGLTVTLQAASGAYVINTDSTWVNPSQFSVYYLGSYSSISYLPIGFPNKAGTGWIWNTPDAVVSAQPYVYTYFTKVYISSSATAGIVYMVCDDVGSLYFNGVLVCSVNWNSICQKSVSIQSGNNSIVVYGYNTGGSAGLALTLKTTLGFVLSTDSTWQWFISDATPTTAPSPNPTLTPSTKPTTPTSQPSSQPSSQPFLKPSSQPSRQPSSQPSSQPFLKPSSQPSTQPSSKPSRQPSSTPSSIPSSQPSSRPSSEPTISCSLGSIIVNNICVPCSPGYISTSVHSLSCTLCPAGTYSSITSCTECPINTYSDTAGSTQCTSCSSGRTTPSTGSASASFCFSPLPNFSLATIALFLSIILIAIYLINGRFFRIGFLRKERIIRRLVEVLRDISRVLDLVSARHDHEQERKSLYNSGDKKHNRTLITILFIVVSIFSVVFTVLFTFASVLAKICFQSLIIYRYVKLLSLVLLILTLLTFLNTDYYRRGYGFKIQAPYLDKVNHMLRVLGNMLRLPYLDKLFYPMIKLYSLMASLNISFSALNITCEGAMSSMELMLNIFIVGMITF